MIRVQRVPHGCHDLGYFAETRIWIFSLDCRLCVPEEEGVRGHGPGNDKDTCKRAISLIPQQYVERRHVDTCLHVERRR